MEPPARASGARLTPLATRRTVMLEQRNVTSSFPFRPWSSLGDGSSLGPLGQPGVFGQHAARVPGLWNLPLAAPRLELARGDVDVDGAADGVDHDAVAIAQERDRATVDR